MPREDLVVVWATNQGLGFSYSRTSIDFVVSTKFWPCCVPFVLVWVQSICTAIGHVFEGIVAMNDLRCCTVVSTVNDVVAVSSLSRLGTGRLTSEQELVVA